MTFFADRREAGQVLAERVVRAGYEDPLILALPRGGVPVGYEVAGALSADLDVVVARKIGVPWRPELGVGAVAGDGEPVFDLGVLRMVGLTPEEMQPVVERERLEVRRRLERYRGDRPPPRVEGRVVVVVDDGLATGVTARAALAALRQQRAGRLVFAAPVCAAEPAAALYDAADEVICVRRLDDLIAVGRWYEDFSQLGDDEVVMLLRWARERYEATQPVIEAATAEEPVQLPDGPPMDELARRRARRRHDR
jgi:predicted phosphoribosyltransferase